ncbi:signal peptidase I [Pseudonocardia acaciae]|uniref:signal peptidase I n=1 Tax=Pseudonocardia acaciae TaxID=551276 RepID=UPI00147055F7|nr:signal peptidase I [Pseudonocardia acaciae]
MAIAAIITFAVVATIVVAVIGVRRRFVVVRVTGTSMEPVLLEGQLVLVRRAGIDAVRRGDLIVFALTAVRMAVPGDPPWMVKRAIAIAGDPIPHESVPPAVSLERTHVPDGHLIVRGDNSRRSFDSRIAGFIDGRALLGVVLRQLSR